MSTIKFDEVPKISELDVLYNTNLFKLQGDELFKVNSSYANDVRGPTDNLISSLSTMPKMDCKSLECAVEKFKSGSVILPIPHLKFNGRQSFQCQKIQNISIGGSLRDDTYVGDSIDIIFDLPFQVTKTDIKTKHYFIKRALVLCHIAQNLSNMSYESLFSTEDTCEWLPFLKIKKDNILFTLRPKITNLDMNLDILLPNHRNSQMIPGYDEHSELTFTPYLNQSILKETYCYEIGTELSESTIQAIILLKNWLKNRPFSTGKFAVSGYMIKSIILYLKHKRLIFDHMSYYQIIRVFFNYIASDKLFSSPSSFNEKLDSGDRLQFFRKYFPVVLLDSSGYYNYLFGLSRNNYDFFRFEAENSLRSLNTGDFGSLGTFKNLFLTKIALNDYFDCFISVSQKSYDWFENVDSKLHVKTLFDIQYSNYDASILCTGRLLKKVIKDRFVLCYFSNNSCPNWKVDSLIKNEGPHIIGILLRRPESLDLTIVGPAVNSSDAIAFRELYGNASKAMKFMDGSVNEVVYLKPISSQFLQSPTEQIVRHAFNIHCGLTDTDIHVLHSQLDCHLLADSAIKLVEILPQVERSLNILSSLLNGKNFKLFKIRSLTGIDPIFSRTSMNENDMLGTSKIHVKILAEIKVKQDPFDQNSESFRLYKFLILATIHQRLKAENLMSEVMFERIEIIMQNFVFDLYLYIPYHLRLLQALNMPTKTLDFGPETCLINYPKEHVDFIRAFTSKYPSFSETVRLFKRWVQAQFMWLYFPSEICELLVASVYHNYFPYVLPLHHLYGLKLVLKLVGYFDWENEFLIIDTQKVDEDNLRKLERLMKNKRNALPPAVILTSYDKTGMAWTSDLFTPVVFNRIKWLARASYDQLHDILPTCKTNLLLQAIFTPNLNDFHIVIELSNVQCHQSRQYYNRLKAHFKGIVTWFSDPLNCKFICGVLDVSLEENNFNVNNCYRRSPTNINEGSCVKGKCKLDLQRVQDDIKLIGEKNISKVDLRNIYIDT